MNYQHYICLTPQRFYALLLTIWGFVTCRHG
jgi:hypothetical protein